MGAAACTDCKNGVTAEPQMLPLRIHGMPVSQNSAGPIMLAIELKAGEMQLCNIMEGKHKEQAFLDINPAGKIPAVDDGHVHGGESNAILRYIALRYGPKFYPVANPPTCFKIDFAIDDFVSSVYPHHPDVVYVGMGFQKEPSAGTQEEANQRLGEAINTWLARHLVGKFGLGERLSIIEFKALPYFFAAMQPLIKQKTGFILSEAARTYVQNIMEAIPDSSSFLTDGDFSIQQFCAKSEDGSEVAITPEEPPMVASPVQVGTPGPIGSVRIHGMPPSQNSCGPIMLAMQANVGTMVLCDLMSGANKTPEYLAINPSGKIPALEDGSVKGGESSAILRYLAMRYAGGLYPRARPAECYSIDFAMDDFSSSVYEAHVKVVYPVFGFADPPEDLDAAHAEYKEKIERWIKAHVRGPFVQGLALSIADLRVVPFFYAALQPAVTKAGFSPPPQMEEYVQEILRQVSATSFLESAGGFAIKEYLATKGWLLGAQTSSGTAS